MKKRVFLIVLIVIIILSGLNILLFTNKGTISYASISGRITDSDKPLPMGISISVIAFIIQWIILLSLLFFAYSKFVKHKKIEELKINTPLIKKKKTKSETDLDILYELLKDKKNLSINSIGKVFDITKEKALEWSKILENHELVRIEYPAFNPPEVRINEKGTKENNQKTV
ncbi:MAG: hypothetical protein KKF48_00330 [Nanoarchaeota archaeon]|nr:hypothetical protein [Nanoarchaeota archaeon]MBU1027471.1 hypothetical protein [Nanoarchaeota archaeon]